MRHPPASAPGRALRVPTCRGWPLGLALAACGLVAQQSSGQTVYFPTSATINTVVGNFQYGAVVGYANQADRNSGSNATSPTVTIVNGGGVSGFLFVYNSSTVDQQGGQVDYFDTLQSSTGNISGGVVNGSVNLEGTSVVNLTGGVISAAGTDGNVNATGNATANLRGGTVENSIGGKGHSVIDVRSGVVGNFVSVDDDAKLSISGGSIGRAVRASGNSDVVISGGAFNTKHNGTVAFYDNTAGSFTFVGTGLSYVDLGPDPAGGEDYGLVGQLSTLLAPGVQPSPGLNLDGYIINVADGAKMFTLSSSTPEPSTLLTLGAACMTMIRRRARH